MFLEGNTLALEKKMKIFPTNKGFTLLELMVALAIFIVVSTIAVSIFLMSVKNQRQAFLVQNLQDNARYMIERFSKEVRMANLQSGSSDTRLKIKNQDGELVQYEFKDSDFERDNNKPLNGEQVDVSGSFFIVDSSSQQFRVTVKMVLTPAGATQPQVRVQNTVTSRQY